MSHINTKTVLLTGGNGFIGSHITVELIEQGYDVIIVDNLSNSTISTYNNVVKLIDNNIKLYNTDITNYNNLDSIFKDHNINCVIHLAAFKAVGESVTNPLKYYHNNITGLITLLQVMTEHNVNKIVFSSSATVYGNPKSLPLTESSPLNVLNPYGQTKLMGENILMDVSKSNNIKTVILRYFNPVGAHPSGLLGESPTGTPNNLFPYILDVIQGKRDKLYVYGDDYDTVDGTGVRDYIHVVDLAKGHVKAVEKIDNIDGTKIYNLGTGKGYSVFQVISKFNEYIDKPVNYCITDRREGDAAEVYADCSLANQELGWNTTKNLDDMAKDCLNFIGR